MKYIKIQNKFTRNIIYKKKSSHQHNGRKSIGKIWYNIRKSDNILSIYKIYMSSSSSSWTCHTIQWLMMYDFTWCLVIENLSIGNLEMRKSLFFRCNYKKIKKNIHLSHIFKKLHNEQVYNLLILFRAFYFINKQEPRALLILPHIHYNK